MMRQPTDPPTFASFTRAARVAILASGITVSWTILAMAGYVIFKLSPLALY